MMSKTLVLWLDAVAFKNISKSTTPFLWNLIQQKRLNLVQQKSSFGFASIPASLLTGTTINKHRQFTVYKTKSDRENVSFWQKTASIFSANFANYWFNLGRYLVGNDFFLPPLAQQAIFNVIPAQQKAYPNPKALPVKTIFDFWREKNESFFYYNWPLAVTNKKSMLTVLTKPNDIQRTETFISLWNKYQPQHSFFHVWDLDSIGHDKGPDHPAFRNILKKYDDLAKKCVSLFDLKKDTIIIFSDHGMLPVTKIVNPLKNIPDTLKANRFVDSTILRLWPQQQLSAKDLRQWKKKMSDHLKKANFGKVLKSNDLKNLGMEKVSKDYGEVLFVLKPGYAFSPTSFASQHKPKAMHGYLDSQINKKDRPIVISNKKLSKVVATERILNAAKLW